MPQQTGPPEEGPERGSVKDKGRRESHFEASKGHLAS